MKANKYDKMMGFVEKKMLYKIRKELISKIEGRVIEVGAGTGINFEHYKDIEVVAIEPDKEMIVGARNKVGNKRIEIVTGDAENLKYEDDSFDSVLITLALCTIPNVEKALMEAKRVCKSEGKLYILEHVRLENRFLGWLQDILTPSWKKFAMGCCLNRDSLKEVEKVGFERVEVKKYFGGVFLYGVFRYNNEIK